MNLEPWTHIDRTQWGNLVEWVAYMGAIGIICLIVYLVIIGWRWSR